MHMLFKRIILTIHIIVLFQKHFQTAMFPWCFGFYGQIVALNYIINISAIPTFNTALLLKSNFQSFLNAEGASVEKCPINLVYLHFVIKLRNANNDLKTIYYHNNITANVFILSTIS